MTKKPSLYVVERREVVILVILFVLVTVLAFTMGVKYGESVGEKTAEMAAAEKERLAANQGSAGGTLQEETQPPVASASPPAASAEASPAADSDHKGAHESAPPEQTATPQQTAAPQPQMLTAKNPPVESPPPGIENPDTDEFLLKALKDAGIEKTQGSDSEAKPESAAVKESALPATVKPAAADKPTVASKAAHEQSGYTIQVASYQSESDARRYAERLKTKRLTAEVSPVVDSGAGRRYTVTLGRYNDLERANDTARNYKARGLIESYFVRKVR